MAEYNLRTAEYNLRTKYMAGWVQYEKKHSCALKLTRDFNYNIYIYIFGRIIVRVLQYHSKTNIIKKLLKYTF